MRPRRVVTCAAAFAAVALCVGAVASATAPIAAPPPKTTPPPTTTPGVPTTTTPGVPTTAPGFPTTATVATLPPLPGTTLPPVTATPAPNVATTTLLTDTSRRIQLTVPASWTDTDLRPFVRDDGGPRPSIEASPDLDTYLQTWSVPGVFLLALPPQDTMALIEVWSWNNSCTRGEPQPFTNGRYTGFTQSWSACGGGNAEIVELAATSADGTHTVYLNVRAPAPDPATRDAIFNSVAAVPGSNPGETSAPVAAPATLVATDPTFVAATTPAGFTTLTDETGRLSVAVDPSWTDVNDVSRDADDLTPRPTLRAAPSLDTYLSDWAAPGLTVSAFKPRVDTYTILTNTAPTTWCTDGGVQALALPTGTGFLHTWTACGGTATRMVQFVLTPADQSATIWGEVQLPTADNTPLLAVLASVAVTP